MAKNDSPAILILTWRGCPRLRVAPRALPRQACRGLNSPPRRLGCRAKMKRAEKPCEGSRFWKGCKPNFVCPAFKRQRPGRESFVSAASTRDRFHRSGTRSGPLRGLLFGLAPDGVYRASSIALGAVGSYPAFSPLPPSYTSDGGGLFSVALSVEKRRRFSPVSIST
jgi:hypothetical protein